MIANQRTAHALRALAASMADQKHDHNGDFGYPEHINFPMLYGMWDRNSLAGAGVSRISDTVWREMPRFQEREASHSETAQEQLIRETFDDRRLWQKLAEAHMRSLVGDYGAAILRIADGKAWHEPVDSVAGGIEAIWDIIPAWESQLVVSKWEQDQRSGNYGAPSLFQFNEVQIEDGKPRGTVRSMQIHPDRVLIWSSTGDTFGRSVLRHGFNSLIDYAKVIGAGGEGFWKAARSSMQLEVLPEAKLQDLAAAMGVPMDELPDKLDEAVSDFVRGYDKSLMMQGIKATPVGVTLPANPEQYYNGPLQAFAASINCPSKVLIGNQTGERASTEDERSWSQTCSARRDKTVKPIIMQMVKRFEQWGVLPKADWYLDWADLTDASAAEKLDGAKKMAEINSAMLGTGELVFQPDEIRESAGWEASDDADGPPEGEPEDVLPAAGIT